MAVFEVVAATEEGRVTAVHALAAFGHGLVPDPATLELELEFVSELGKYWFLPHYSSCCLKIGIFLKYRNSGNVFRCMNIVLNDMLSLSLLFA